MIAYPDTSFLVSLYVQQEHSPRAAAHFAALAEPLHVTELLLYEFRHAVRFAVFRAEHGSTDIVTRADAVAALDNLEADLAAGALVLASDDWPTVLQTAAGLSARYGMDAGYRAFDMLHVASALHLGAEEMLSFDGKQCELASAEGLRIPL